MSDNVISLRGASEGPTAVSGQPNPSCVNELERLLEAARAGEIIGLAGSYVHCNHVVSYSYAGALGGYSLIGGLTHLKHILMSRLTG